MKKTTLALLLAAMCAAAPAHAALTPRFAALDIAMGARPVAMGLAYTALSDEASSVYWNPAGLAGLDMFEVSAAYNKWIYDSSVQYAAGLIPAGPGAMAVEFTYADFGQFEQLDDFGASSGDPVRSYSINAGVGYGMAFGGPFSAGLSARYCGLTIDNSAEHGLVIDAGVRYRFSDAIVAAAALRGIDPMSGSLAPATTAAGLGAYLGSADTGRLAAALDIDYSPYYGASLSAGAEYLFSGVAAFRAGYRWREQNGYTQGVSGLSAGMGIYMGMFNLNYAFTSLGDAGAVHLLDLRFVTTGREKSEKEKYRKLNSFLAYQYSIEAQDLYDNRDFARALLKWQQAKELDPSLEGIDESIRKATRMKAGMAEYKKADTAFREGMASYEAGKYDAALKKWQEVKKMSPEYKDIDTWLSDARELSASGGLHSKAEAVFNKGLKYFNECEYEKALQAWEEAVAKDPENKKIRQYLERLRQRQNEIAEKMSRARAEAAKETTVIQGIKKLRDITKVCPAFKDANDALSAMAEIIKTKCREYYYNGIERYTDGDLDEAIRLWKNIELLDPKSEYRTKVRRYIEDAYGKQKAAKKLDNGK